MASENDDDSQDRFTEDERITANLRLRSVSPVGRTVLAFFAFIPPHWRGPVALVVCCILGYLASQATPALIHYLQK